MTPDMEAVRAAIKSMSHYYAWMTYPEIRRLIAASSIPKTASGKHHVLCALAQLERDGFVRWKRDNHERELWGLKP